MRKKATTIAIKNNNNQKCPASPRKTNRCGANGHSAICVWRFVAVAAFDADETCHVNGRKKGEMFFRGHLASFDKIATPHILIDEIQRAIFCGTNTHF